MENNTVETIKTRVLLKTGTNSEWNEASENGFVPLLGEICIYTDYETTQEDDSVILIPNIKIGNGLDNINDLPFFRKEVIDCGEWE